MRSTARVFTILTASFALLSASCGDEKVVNPGQCVGDACAETDDDAADCQGACDTDARCVLNASAQQVCRCAEGFAGNGRSCTPVADSDACGGCDEHASCLQTTSNDAQCRCDAGWVGDGKSCEQPTSCDDRNGGCHPKATCTQTAQTLSCECAHGFEGDGYTCLPPIGGYVKVAGNLSLNYATTGCTGNAVWAFDLRFNGQGARFATPGIVETTVWKAEAAVDFIDFDTGELSLDFVAQTWLDHPCPGRIDFLWANAKDAEHTWTNVPVSADLKVFGEDIPWYWSATGVTVSDVKSTLVTTFEKP